MRIMSLERHLLALKRIRAIIASGAAKGAVDSDEIGNKYTTCKWGLCNETKEAWPDPEDYIWPDQKDRVAPVQRPRSCPLRMHDSVTHGCFYQCRAFKTKLTREEALALYDVEIARLS